MSILNYRAYLIFVPLFLLSITSTQAEERLLTPKEEGITLKEPNDPCIDSWLFYIKFGGGTMPEGAPSVSLGIGGRYRFGHHGLDVSLNGQAFYAIIAFDGSLITKAQYLYYPYPNSRSAMYFGAGGGYGCGLREWFVHAGGGLGISHFLTADCMIGWEFRRDKRIKPFLQLELSQPAVYFKGKNYRPWSPAVVFSAGLGW